MSDDTISITTKELAKKIAEAKEAFILEEMKPYYDYIDMATGKIVWSQKVRLRLASYKDWKRQFEQEKEKLRCKLMENIINYCEDNYLSHDALVILINKCFGVIK